MEDIQALETVQALEMGVEAAARNAPSSFRDTTPLVVLDELATSAR